MEIRHVILLIFVSSALYVYFRGRVRFGVIRSLTDYVVLLSPINAIRIGFDSWALCCNFLYKDIKTPI